AANDVSREYGDANPAFDATITGFKNGETAATSVTGSPGCTSVATPTTPVTGSPYAISCTIGTLAAGNYTFAHFVAGNLTVTPAPLTVTANDKSRVYGNPTPPFDAKITGFKNGE